MAAAANSRDPESGYNEFKEPLLQSQSVDDRSIGIVLLSSLIALLGAYEFGTCVGFTAPAQSDLIKDLHLSIPEFSAFGSILTIGAILGAISCGRAADLLGRKGAMQVSSVLCIVGWIAIFFSKGAVSLDLGRFFTGWGIGIFSYVVPIYVSEIAPTRIRGGLTTMNQLLIVVGASCTLLLGIVVGWRELAIHGIAPCALMLIGLFFVPESPRWLAKVGKMSECETSLRRLRGKDADISIEVNQIKDNLELIEKLPRVGILDLFQERYLLSVTIAFGLMMLQQLGGCNGIGFYTSQIFLAAGNSSANVGLALCAFIQVPINILSVPLMDGCGRKPLILLSTSGTTLSCIMTGLAFFMKDHSMLVDWVPVLVVAGVLMFATSFSIGLGAVPWVIMSEIFPLNVKGVAGGMVNLIHWIVAWLVSYTFNFLFTWSPMGTFFVYAAFNASIILFVIKLMPETKGRTLEQIQAQLHKASSYNYKD